MKQKQAAESTIAELRQSLQQEQKKTAALTQEAKAAQAMTTGAEPQRRALEEAQARAAALASELAGTRREIETQAAQSQKAVDAATKQKQAAETAIAELRQSLQQEQKKTAALTQEAKAAQAGTRREIETQAAQSQKAVDVVKQAAESTIAELRQSLQQEQKKTAALTQEAKAAQAMTASAEQQRRALEEAQARAAALASELAGTRREIETQAAQSQKAVDEAVQTEAGGGDHHREFATISAAGAQRAETLSSEVRGKLKALATLSRQKHDEDAQLKPVSTEAKGSEAAGLLARAKALVGQGNIRAARDVLERAAETGSAQATFALAETYDPNVLATWRTRGTRGDATKARDLYARAYEGGIKAAKDRSDALVIAGGGRKPASWFGREEADH